MSLHGKSLIAGLPAETGSRTFRAINPQDSSDLDPEFHESPLEDVDRALVHAEEAFGHYRRTSGTERAAFLEAIATEILALGDDLISRAHQETGLPVDRLTGERGRTVGQLRLFAEVAREGSWVDARIDPALPDRKPLPRPDLRRMLIPLGPVVVFGASNFPLAFSVAGGDTASALAAGNPVIVKGHPAHPGTSELVASAIVKAAETCQLPPGVFALLHGHVELGLELVRHPLTRAVAFTGSQRAGRALFDAAATRPDPIPVFAEMSSLNPLFILPGALRERGPQIVEGLKNSVTLGVGQFCTKPGLVFGIGSTEFESFAELLAAAFGGTTPGTMLQPGICRSYHEGLDRVGELTGVVSLGTSATEPDPEKNQGEPMVFATDVENFLGEPKLHQEVFGPATLLVDASSYTDLVRVAHNLEGQLTATIHGTPEDFENATDLLAILERKAGRLVINSFPTGVEVSPAMHHGGPYPATTDERFTSVGTAAIQRFARPLCYQSYPANALPPELADANPIGIMRQINGKLGRSSVDAS